MLISTLLTSAVTAFADLPDLSPDMMLFAQEASGWVLEGQSLPPDYRQKLHAMAPADRLQAIIFLRRSGLLNDDVWPLEDVLRDAVALEQTQK